MTSDNKSWRTIDVLIASVLGMACGLLFLFWNSVGYVWYESANALTPGFGGIAVGIWLIGGVLGGLIIRKPGAAIYVEVLAAITSMLLGSQWGISTVMSGLVQGIGAELIFLIFAYRRFSLGVAALAGMAAGWAAFIWELFASANYAKTLAFNLTYLGTMTISGAVLAGALGWLIVRALAPTGVLDRFAAGQENHRV